MLPSLMRIGKSIEPIFLFICTEPQTNQKADVELLKKFDLDLKYGACIGKKMISSTSTAETGMRVDPQTNK